jgi:8-oxo-dGTP diphosphatase
MSRKQYCYEFPRPAVTTDVVALARGNRPRVLLIRRKKPPFAGMWAIPGGFVNIDEDLEAAARREFFEETGLHAARLLQLETFGDPARDPRGRTISVVFVTWLGAGHQDTRAGDDAAQAAWHSLKRPPALAFDHAKILARVRRWLRERP